MRKLSLIFGLTSMLAYGQQDGLDNFQVAIDSTEALKEVIISANKLLGSKFEARNRTGSAFFLSTEDLKKHNYLDITRVLAEVPGVNVYEEDGFGLRPNISLRGSSPERSAKITIMEDGVLAAPAPYSAPAAYYMPNVGRMQAVEVLKGSSQIQYGPFTTGGAINFVSTEIPTEFMTEVRANYGSFGTSNSLLRFGESFEQVGYVVEYMKNRSSGFKELDGPGGTGFDRNDIMSKIRFNTKKDAKVHQSLEFKFQYADEDSDETYLGLTQEDYDASSFRRYAGSQKDNMRTFHRQVMLTHQLKFSDYSSITTTLYNNSFARNWYRLANVRLNGSTINLTNLLENPANFPEAMDIIRGEADSPEDALTLRNNLRKYYSRGIQTKFDHHFVTGDVFHDLEVGLRYHRDEEDRFQWNDTYAMINGIMGLTSPGIPGTDSNRISGAEATSAHLLYKLKWNNLTIAPGLRYENVSLIRRNWGNADVDRSNPNPERVTNRFDQFIPGIGFNYKLNNDISFFTGVHKGFSPAGFADGQSPESSTNFELGSRFNLGGIEGEIVGFFNDFSNLLGSDFAATGGIDGDMDLFNAGAVEVKGIELQLAYDLLKKNTKYKLPIIVAYTYTTTEFKSDFSSPIGTWGDVSVGDELPYIPNNQFNFGIGFSADKFSVNASARYRDEFRTLAGTGIIPPNQKVESMFVVDLSSEYQLTQKLSLTTNIINLLDNHYAASRVPSGLRPGHPFGIYGGFILRI